MASTTLKLVYENDDKTVSDTLQFGDSSCTDDEFNATTTAEEMEGIQTTENNRRAGPSKLFTRSRSINVIFSWITEFQKAARSLLGFERTHKQVLGLMGIYISHIKNELPSCLRYPNRSIILAQNITRMLLLFKELNMHFDESNEYLQRVSQLLLFFTKLELKYSNKFEEPKQVVANRIALNYDVHLQNANEYFVLRIFVNLENNIQKEILSKIFEKYLKKDQNVQKRELEDKIYIMYLISFKKWHYVEVDGEERLKIYEYANAFMKPRITLRRNPLYAPYLPAYQNDDNITHYILSSPHFKLFPLISSLKKEESYEEINTVIDNVIEIENLVICDDTSSPKINMDSTNSTDVDSGICIINNNFNESIKLENPEIVATIDLTEEAPVKFPELYWLNEFIAKCRRSQPVSIQKCNRQDDGNVVAIIDLDDDDDGDVENVAIDVNIGTRNNEEEATNEELNESEEVNNTEMNSLEPEKVTEEDNLTDKIKETGCTVNELPTEQNFSECENIEINRTNAHIAEHEDFGGDKMIIEVELGNKLSDNSQHVIVEKETDSNIINEINIAKSIYKICDTTEIKAAVSSNEQNKSIEENVEANVMNISEEIDLMPSQDIFGELEKSTGSDMNMHANEDLINKVNEDITQLTVLSEINTIQSDILERASNQDDDAGIQPSLTIPETPNADDNINALLTIAEDELVSDKNEACKNSTISENIAVEQEINVNNNTLNCSIDQHHNTTIYEGSPMDTNDYDGNEMDIDNCESTNIITEDIVTHVESTENDMSEKGINTTVLNNPEIQSQELENSVAENINSTVAEILRESLIETPPTTECTNSEPLNYNHIMTTEEPVKIRECSFIDCSEQSLNMSENKIGEKCIPSKIQNEDSVEYSTAQAISNLEILDLKIAATTSPSFSVFPLPSLSSSDLPTTSSAISTKNISPKSSCASTLLHDDNPEIDNSIITLNNEVGAQINEFQKENNQQNCENTNTSYNISAENLFDNPSTAENVDEYIQDDTDMSAVSAENDDINAHDTKELSEKLSDDDDDEIKYIAKNITSNPMIAKKTYQRKKKPTIPNINVLNLPPVKNSTVLDLPVFSSSSSSEFNDDSRDSNSLSILEESEHIDAESASSPKKQPKDSDDILITKLSPTKNQSSNKSATENVGNVVFSMSTNRKLSLPPPKEDMTAKHRNVVFSITRPQLRRRDSTQSLQKGESMADDANECSDDYMLGQSNSPTPSLLGLDGDDIASPTMEQFTNSDVVDMANFFKRIPTSTPSRTLKESNIRREKNYTLENAMSKLQNTKKVSIGGSGSDMQSVSEHLKQNSNNNSKKTASILNNRSDELYDGSPNISQSNKKKSVSFGDQAYRKTPTTPSTNRQNFSRQSIILEKRTYIKNNQGSASSINNTQQSTISNQEILDLKTGTSIPPHPIYLSPSLSPSGLAATSTVTAAASSSVKSSWISSPLRVDNTEMVTDRRRWISNITTKPKVNKLQFGNYNMPLLRIPNRKYSCCNIENTSVRIHLEDIGMFLHNRNQISYRQYLKNRNNFQRKSFFLQKKSNFEKYNNILMASSQNSRKNLKHTNVSMFNNTSADTKLKTKVIKNKTTRQRKFKHPKNLIAKENISIENVKKGHLLRSQIPNELLKDTTKANTEPLKNPLNSKMGALKNLRVYVSHLNNIPASSANSFKTNDFNNLINCEKLKKRLVVLLDNNVKKISDQYLTKATIKRIVANMRNRQKNRSTPESPKRLTESPINSELDQSPESLQNENQSNSNIVQIRLRRYFEISNTSEKSDLDDSCNLKEKCLSNSENQTAFEKNYEESSGIDHVQSTDVEDISEIVQLDTISESSRNINSTSIVNDSQLSPITNSQEGNNLHSIYNAEAHIKSSLDNSKTDETTLSCNLNGSTEVSLENTSSLNNNNSLSLETIELLSAPIEIKSDGNIVRKKTRKRRKNLTLKTNRRSRSSEHSIKQSSLAKEINFSNLKRKKKENLLNLEISVCGNEPNIVHPQNNTESIIVRNTNSIIDNVDMENSLNSESSNIVSATSEVKNSNVFLNGPSTSSSSHAKVLLDDNKDLITDLKSNIAISTLSLPVSIQYNKNIGISQLVKIAEARNHRSKMKTGSTSTGENINIVKSAQNSENISLHTLSTKHTPAIIYPVERYNIISNIEHIQPINNDILNGSGQISYVNTIHTFGNRVPIVGLSQAGNTILGFQLRNNEVIEHDNEVSSTTHQLDLQSSEDKSRRGLRRRKTIIELNDSQEEIGPSKTQTLINNEINYITNIKDNSPTTTTLINHEKKRRGRPKGSRNKVKNLTSIDTKICDDEIQSSSSYSERMFGDVSEHDLADRQQPSDRAQSSLTTNVHPISSRESDDEPLINLYNRHQIVSTETVMEEESQDTCALEDNRQLSESPEEMNINSDISRTYSKDSIIQNVYVPPEVEKIFESDRADEEDVSV